MEYSVFYYLIFFLISLVLSYFLTRVMIKLSFKFKILDNPGSDRKIHENPIPLLGGWGIFLSFSFIILFLFFFFPQIILGKEISVLQIFGILFSGLILMIFGTMDDKYNLSARAQFFWVTISCLVVLITGTAIKVITRPGGGVIDLTLGIEASFIGINFYLIVSIITFIWLIFITNTTKLLDGLDGLAGGITSIGMIILFIVSLFWNKANSATSILIIIFLGSIIGFLFLNFHPAKIFLGNGGSNLLGLYLGVFAIISGAKIATAFLVMGAPLLDMIWVIIQRIRRRENPFRHADKKHLHFRLLDLGFSRVKAVLILYFIAFSFGVVSLFQATFGKIIIATILVLFMIILFVYIDKKQKNAV